MKGLVAVLLIFCSVAAGAQPQRIVSANLCADRLVLALADRDKIVSVTHYAADPAMSTVSTQTAGLTLNHGDAEEIAALHPDLVIFGMYTQKAASDMLKALGYPVFMMPHARDLAGMREAIRALSARLGVPERGEAMIARIDSALDKLTPHKPSRAAFYMSGGWTSGAPSLADDLLRRLGARNIPTDAGVGSAGTLPLETLIAAGPDLIIFETAGDEEPKSLASQLLEHPALAGRGIRHLHMPMKLWDCPDDAVIEAAHLIDEALP